MIWDERKPPTFTKIKGNILSHSSSWAAMWLMTASPPCLRMRSGGMKGVGEGDLKSTLRVVGHGVEPASEGCWIFILGKVSTMYVSVASKL